MSKLVSLTYLNDYNPEDVENAVKDAVSSIGVANLIKPKMKVLVKACLPTSISADMAETTHPAVVRALANWLKEMGAECIVVDSPYKKYSLDNLEKVYLNTGMLDVANQTTCVLNKDLSTFTIETPNGVMSKSLTLMDVINKVDVIINVGKLKIDSKLGYLGATSNLFGFVPGEMKNQVLARLQTQKDFHNYVLDIYDVLKSKIVFNVLDGIVSLEGGNTPRMLNCLAVADNMLSLDAAIIDILEIGYKNTVLKQAKHRGWFEFDKGFKLVGEKLEKFKIKDFSLIEFNEGTKIHTNERERKTYFNKHQLRTKIEKNHCKGCSVCSKICPTGAITMKTDKNGELYASINYSNCIFCNKCHTACPYKVVDVINPMGHKKLMKEINKQNEQENAQN